MRTSSWLRPVSSLSSALSNIDELSNPCCSLHSSWASKTAPPSCWLVSIISRKEVSSFASFSFFWASTMIWKPPFSQGSSPTLSFCCHQIRMLSNPRFLTSSPFEIGDPERSPAGPEGVASAPGEELEACARESQRGCKHKKAYRAGSAHPN